MSHNGQNLRKKSYNFEKKRIMPTMEKRDFIQRIHRAARWGSMIRDVQYKHV
jgi:hypothetical protein